MYLPIYKKQTFKKDMVSYVEYSTSFAYQICSRFQFWPLGNNIFSASTVVNKILHVGTKAHLHSRYIYFFFQV